MENWFFCGAMRFAHCKKITVFDQPGFRNDSDLAIGQLELDFLFQNELTELLERYLVFTKTDLRVNIKPVNALFYLQLDNGFTNKIFFIAIVRLTYLETKIRTSAWS